MVRGITLEPTLAEAIAAKREYTEALMRGEEPHYPQWADEVLKGANNE